MSVTPNIIQRFFSDVVPQAGIWARKSLGFIFFLMSKTKEWQELTLMINFNTPNTQLREKIYTYILDAPQIDIPPPVYLVHVTIKKEIESTV